MKWQPLKQLRQTTLLNGLGGAVTDDFFFFEVSEKKRKKKWVRRARQTPRT